MRGNSPLKQTKTLLKQKTMRENDLVDNEIQNINTYKNTPFIDYYVGFKDFNSTAFEISLLCECERIWITYDENEDGELDFDEVYNYIETSVPYLGLTKDEVWDLFDEMDDDGNGILDR
jgi:hypothetical protein